jgi:hypothetical protein
LVPWQTKESSLFDVDEKDSVSVANSVPASIWNDDSTSLFDPSPLKCSLFHGAPLLSKSAEELMQQYFDLWRENKMINSGEVASTSISHAKSPRDRARRMYTVPLVHQSDNPLQASSSGPKR